jgi:hypothetical protein
MGHIKKIIEVEFIVIKPGLGIDLAKGSCLEFHRSTYVNPEKF